MDIEEFYDANESRRQSAEFEFGDNWTDDQGQVHELSWIENTGELYLMGVPREDAGARADDELYPALAVTVLAVITTHDGVEAALVGWDAAMDESDSVSWLRNKFPSSAA